MSHAEQHGFLPITPEFAECYYGSGVYLRGNILTGGGEPVDSAWWTFTTVERVWDKVRTRSGSSRDRYRIYGTPQGASS